MCFKCNGNEANSVGNSVVSLFKRGGSMPEKFPISIFSCSNSRIQEMPGLWGSKRAYIQLGETFFFQTQPCRHTIE